MEQEKNRINIKLISLARRYSSALIKTAVQNNQLDVVFNDLKSINETFNSSPDMEAFLLHPAVTIEDKKDVLNKVFANNITNTSLNFLYLLTDESKVNLISTILYTFEEEFNAINNITTVEVTSAVDIDEDLKSKLQTKLETKLDKKVTMNYIINPDIVGGLILNLNGKTIDASIAAKIKSFEKQLA